MAIRTILQRIRLSFSKINLPNVTQRTNTEPEYKLCLPNLWLFFILANHLPLSLYHTGLLLFFFSGLCHTFLCYRLNESNIHV